MENHAFTIEQVEDVKTFLRLLATFSVCEKHDNKDVGMLVDVMMKELTYSKKSNTPTRACYLKGMIYYVTTSLLMPIYEFSIYAMFRKCFSYVKIRFERAIQVYCSSDYS